MKRALKEWLLARPLNTVLTADIVDWCRENWPDGDWHSRADRIDIVMGWLGDLAGENALAFLKRRVRIDGVSVPEKIRIRREAPERFSVPEGYAWHPALPFWRDLKSGKPGDRSRLEMAFILSEWLKENGIPKDPLPVGEFSLMVFGDEKWLKGSGDFSGKLEISTINLYETKIPLLFAKAEGTGKTALFVENSETWSVFSEWNGKSRAFAGVAYGEGGRIGREGAIAEAMRLMGARTAFYFGDLDPRGVIMGTGSGFPPCLPLYRWLLEKGARNRSWERKDRADCAHLDAVRSWMPELWRDVKRLWREEKAWCPQEGCGVAALREIGDALIEWAESVRRKKCQ